MKIQSLLTSSATLLALAAFAQADPDVYDGFDYGTSPGVISGQNGGTGFSAAWENPFNGDFSYSATGLTFSNLSTVGGAATYSASTANAYDTGVISRSLASIYSSSFTVYGSYIFQASGETDPWAGFTLGNGPTMYNDAYRYFGVSTSYDGLNAPDAYSAYFGASAFTSGSPLLLDQTYIYLFKFDHNGSHSSGAAWVLSASQFAYFKSSGDSITESELDSASQGTSSDQVIAKLSASGDASSSDYDTVTFDARNFYTTNARNITVDEMRMSSGSLDDVTPTSGVPEPGTVALVGLGAAALLYHARRRRA